MKECTYISASPCAAFHMLCLTHYALGGGSSHPARGMKEDTTRCVTNCASMQEAHLERGGGGGGRGSSAANRWT